MPPTTSCCRETGPSRWARGWRFEEQAPPELRTHSQPMRRKTLGFPGPSDGASRARTGDLLGAIQALSQLSYSPASGRVDGLSQTSVVLRARATWARAALTVAEYG